MNALKLKPPSKLSSKKKEENWAKGEVIYNVDGYSLPNMSLWYSFEPSQCSKGSLSKKKDGTYVLYTLVHRLL